jgi:DNA-binding MarR family transcriptional regulator
MDPSRTIDHGNAPLSILKSKFKPRFTEKQGQYLAFIHTYVLLHRRAPAEADMQAYFRVTPPSVHRMVVELKRLGLIRRIPRQARSITLCLPAEEIPPLRA